jgi:hypothetical protein
VYCAYLIEGAMPFEIITNIIICCFKKHLPFKERPDLYFNPFFLFFQARKVSLKLMPAL